MLESVVLVLLLYFHTIICQNHGLEGKIVNAENASISEFPYSVFLGASCVNMAWDCGASILNQYILLTAAHCVYECNAKRSSIIAKFGNTNFNRGTESLSRTYLTHPDYNEAITEYDIGLVLMRVPLRFGRNVARVAVMRSPPYNEIGQIAGWGMIDEVRGIHTTTLKHTTQEVTRRKPCEKLLGPLPEGVICAGGFNSNSYVSKGDSGSALVVRKYIQIGIVSFKRADISRSLVVYSDVGYFFDWIRDNAQRLFCSRSG